MNGQFELGSITPTRYFFTIASTLGLLFAFIAGDDSNEGIVLQLIRWQFQTLGPMAFMIASHIWLNRHHLLRFKNPWLNLTCSGVFGLLLFSPFNFFVDLFLQNEYPQSVSWFNGWLEELSYLLPPAILAWIAINAPWVLGYRVQQIDDHSPLDAAKPPAKNRLVTQKENHTHPHPPNKEKSNFLDLLGNSLTGELLYLKAELHYLLAVSAEGKSLMLYSLKDAMDELDQTGNYDGFHCHRSYWVPAGQVQKLKKKGRQGVLLMPGGEQIPVSRNKLVEATARFEDRK